MARNGAGTYSLPAGQPVVTGTTISAATFNTLTSDLSTELTDSLSRSGKGGMTAALLSADGAVGAPQYSFTSDTDTGTYRIGANDWAVACGGVKQFELTTAAATIVQPLTCSALITGSAGITVTGAGITLTVGTANTSATIKGNRTGADTGADVVLNSVATRTAGNLLEVQNNTTAKFDVDFSGQVKWPSGPASTATTPAPSAVTVPGMAAGWTATNGLGYWKDPLNMVHLKGSVLASGAVAPAFTLPAGFRPGNDRVFYYSVANVTQTITVKTDGTVVPSDIANPITTWLDGVHFLAEA